MVLTTWEQSVLPVEAGEGIQHAIRVIICRVIGNIQDDCTGGIRRGDCQAEAGGGKREEQMGKPEQYI